MLYVLSRLNPIVLLQTIHLHYCTTVHNHMFQVLSGGKAVNDTNRYAIGNIIKQFVHFCFFFTVKYLHYTRYLYTLFSYCMYLNISLYCILSNTILSATRKISIKSIKPIQPKMLSHSKTLIWLDKKKSINIWWICEESRNSE